MLNRIGDEKRTKTIFFPSFGFIFSPFYKSAALNTSSDLGES